MRAGGPVGVRILTDFCSISASHSRRSSSGVAGRQLRRTPVLLWGRTGDPCAGSTCPLSSHGVPQQPPPPRPWGVSAALGCPSNSGVLQQQQPPRGAPAPPARPADGGHVMPTGQSGAAGRPSAAQGLLRHNKHKPEQLAAATPGPPCPPPPGRVRSAAGRPAARKGQARTRPVGRAPRGSRRRGAFRGGTRLAVHRKQLKVSSSDWKIGRVGAAARGGTPGLRPPGARPRHRGGGGVGLGRGSRAKLSSEGEPGPRCGAGPCGTGAARAPPGWLGGSAPRGRGCLRRWRRGRAAPGPHKGETAGPLAARQLQRQGKPPRAGESGWSRRDPREKPAA